MDRVPVEGVGETFGITELSQIEDQIKRLHNPELDGGVGNWLRVAIP